MIKISCNVEVFMDNSYEIEVQFIRLSTSDRVERLATSRQLAAAHCLYCTLCCSALLCSAAEEQLLSAFYVLSWVLVWGRSMIFDFCNRTQDPPVCSRPTWCFSKSMTTVTTISDNL